MTQQVQGLQVASVHVNDFDRARKFYRNALGLEEMMADDDMGWAMFEVPGSTPLGIHQFDKGCNEAGGRPPGTVSGLVFTVNDANAFAEHVQQNGGTLTDPVEQLPWGPLGGTMADPDGNEFAFSEPPEA